VSPVRYELGFYIPEGDILHSHCGENLKSYIPSIVLTYSCFRPSELYDIFKFVIKYNIFIPFFIITKVGVRLVYRFRGFLRYSNISS
jgi:hypothetical protein